MGLNFNGDTIFSCWICPLHIVFSLRGWGTCYLVTESKDFCFRHVWVCDSVQLFIRWVNLDKLFPCKVTLRFHYNICMWVCIYWKFHIFFFAFSIIFALSFSELKQELREIWGSNVYRNFYIFKISLTPSLNLLKFSLTCTILYSFSLVYIDF